MKKDNIKIDPNETVWYGQDSTGSRCGAFMDHCEDFAFNERREIS
jgi:hypothetical protein